MRVVSLCPSTTEVIAELGATDMLVGRSHRCNHPDRVSDIPVVTTSALSDRGPADPGEIDAAIEDHRHGEGTAFRVIPEQLRETAPDVVVTQSLCEVCAVPESMTVDVMRSLDPEPAVVSVSPTTIDGIFDSIEQVGRALERSAAATRLVARLEDRIDAVQAARPAIDAAERVACLEWVDPPRCHGLWVSEIVDRLGATDGFGTPGAPGHEVDWADIVAYDPEVLVVSPCGRSVPEIRSDMHDLIDRPGWTDLAAVQDDRVYLLDGELSSRHGPRVVRALELVATMLYPDAVDQYPWRSGEVARAGRPTGGAADPGLGSSGAGEQ